VASRLSAIDAAIHRGFAASRGDISIHIMGDDGHVGRYAEIGVFCGPRSIARAVKLAVRYLVVTAFWSKMEMQGSLCVEFPAPKTKTRRAILNTD
jgi:hypothetical protein